MSRIQSINPLSSFKIGSLIFAILGFVAGALCSTAAFAGFRIAYHPTLTGGLALLPIVLCPIFWGLFGGLGAIVIALLYNLCAALFGGLEVEIR